MKHLLIITGFLFGHLMSFGAVNAQTCTNVNIPESTPDSRYVFHANGTVTDTKTDLMWKRCLEGQIFSTNNTPKNYLDDKCMGNAVSQNWEEALAQVQVANAANDKGYNDWYLPNLKELKSTVEYCRTNPAINTGIFPGWAEWMWSGSPVIANGGDKTWIVNFYYGGDNMYERHYGMQVRLVRSAQ